MLPLWFCFIFGQLHFTICAPVPSKNPKGIILNEVMTSSVNYIGSHFIELAREDVTDQISLDGYSILGTFHKLC